MKNNIPNWFAQAVQSFKEIDIVQKEVTKIEKAEAKEKRNQCKECNHKLEKGKCVNYTCKRNKSK